MQLDQLERALGNLENGPMANLKIIKIKVKEIAEVVKMVVAVVKVQRALQVASQWTRIQSLTKISRLWIILKMEIRQIVMAKNQN